MALMAVIDLPNRGVRSVFGSPERGWFEWKTVGRHSRGFDRLTRPLHVQHAARLDTMDDQSDRWSKGQALSQVTV